MKSWIRIRVPWIRTIELMCCVAGAVVLERYQAGCGEKEEDCLVLMMLLEAVVLRHIFICLYHQMLISLLGFG